MKAGRKFATIAAVGAVAAGGTAYAAGEDPFADREEAQAEFAADLAAELDGVNAGEVETALETVAEERMAEHRAEMAAAIAEGLDGVSADRIEAALEAHRAQAEDSAGQGERPDPSELAAFLADELGVDEAEVGTAMRAAHAEHAGEDGHRGFGPGHRGPGGPGFGPPPFGGPGD